MHACHSDLLSAFSKPTLLGLHGEERPVVSPRSLSSLSLLAISSLPARATSLLAESSLLDGPMAHGAGARKERLIGCGHLLCMVSTESETMRGYCSVEDPAIDDVDGRGTPLTSPSSSLFAVSGGGRPGRTVWNVVWRSQYSTAYKKSKSAKG